MTPDDIVASAYRAARRRDDAGHGQLIATAWAAAKILATAPALPAATVATMARARTNHQRACHIARTYPTSVRKNFDAQPATSADRVTLDSATNVLITSDIHRAADDSTSWASRSGADEVYQAMVRRYGRDGWTLVENGDNDDFWLVGGSSWGVAYDALRLAGGMARFVGRPAMSNAVAAQQMRAIAEHHRETYATIAAEFSDGRYLRTVGNHDDVVERESVQRVLGEIVPDACVTRRVLLLGADMAGSAVITHGHDTDGWNAPRRAELGVATTWLVASLGDLVVGRNLFGPPDASTSTTIRQGTWPNRVLEVHPVLGANLAHDSMDEEVLAQSIDDDSRPMPWLIFGHTHSPVLEPTRPNGRVFRQYANSGAGMWNRMVTAIEWHGAPAVGEPRLDLVAFDLEGRRLRRTVLQSRSLNSVDNGEFDRSGGRTGVAEAALAAF